MPKEPSAFDTAHCESERPRPLVSSEMRYHGEPLNLTASVGFEKAAVVPERDAAVGVTVRAQHVSVREQTCSSVDRAPAADGIEPQRRDAVKQRFARLQVVEMRRGRDAASGACGYG